MLSSLFSARCAFEEVAVMFWFLFSAVCVTCTPVQTLGEIIRTVEQEETLLNSDLESIISLTPKSWSPHVIDNEVSAELEPMAREPRLYVVLDEPEETEERNTTATPEQGHNKRDVDPWSLVWYMASFGGLVTFFLVVSCSECCCSKRSTPPNTSTARPADPPPQETAQWVDETPPPPYHLFAPPSYDTLFYGVGEEKKKCEIFTVPVHGSVSALSIGTSDATSEPP